MLKVLIVDDEPFVREGLKSFIDWTKYGFTICGGAENAEEAIKLITELSPHLVITDIKMPEMDGLELIRYLVNDMKSSAKFIILSGHSDFKYAQTAIKYNVRDYILKPVDEDELIEALSRIYNEIQNELKLEKEHMINGNFFNSKAGVAFYEEAKDITFNYNFNNEISFTRLLEAVEKSKHSEISSIIDSIFTKFHSDLIAPEIIRACIINFELGVIKVISDMNGNADEFAKQAGVFELDKSRLYELKEALTKFCMASTRHVKKLKDNQTIGILYEVEKYINKNYKRDINLKSIAEHFFINPVYLGQLFKKNFGKYFNDYLHNLRIEEAKKLLRRTDFKIYEVAGDVGYGDPDYFISKFEKITGMTPTQYKKIKDEL